MFEFYIGDLLYFTKINERNLEDFSEEELVNRDNYELVMENVIFLKVNNYNYIPIDLLTEQDFFNIIENVEYLFDSRSCTPYLEKEKNGYVIDPTTLELYQSNIKKKIYKIWQFFLGLIFF